MSHREYDIHMFLKAVKSRFTEGQYQGHMENMILISKALQPPLTGGLFRCFSGRYLSFTGTAVSIDRALFHRSPGGQNNWQKQNNSGRNYTGLCFNATWGKYQLLQKLRCLHWEVVLMSRREYIRFQRHYKASFQRGSVLVPKWGINIIVFKKYFLWALQSLVCVSFQQGYG